MTNDQKDLGVAFVLLKKFTDDTLPKALEIKSRVDAGQRLDHWDIDFLSELFRRAEEIKPLVDRHPEYQALYAQGVHMYKQITDQALINEKQSPAA